MVKNNKLKEWFKKYYPYMILIFVVPYLYRYFLNFKLKMISEDKRAELKYFDELKKDVVAQDEYLHSLVGPTYTQIARELLHHTGFAYSWYDPRRWTENDLEIYKLLKDFNPIPSGIVQAYYVLSAGRSLRSDLMSVLDTKYYSKLRF